MHSANRDSREEDSRSVRPTPAKSEKNISETSGLYFDLAPYIKGFDKSSTAKVTTAFTIGMKFKLSAFGSGFSPHLIYEFVDDYQQFGLFANFDLF